MRARTVVGIVVTLGAVGAVGWVVATKRRPVEVTVARVIRGPIESAFTAEATVKGTTVEIEPETSGRILQIHVLEGDQVTQGQTLCQLRSDELESAVERAKAAADGALQRKEQAEHALDLTRKQTHSRIEEAQAALKTAQARLQLVLAGPQPQEVSQAEQRVRQAQVTEGQAKNDYDRAKRLYDEGAIPLAEYQRAKTAYDDARANTAIAMDGLALLKKGATKEERAAARAEVAQAQTALDSANASKEQIDVSEHDLAAATALYAQAISTQKEAEAAHARATVKAPFAGRVSYIPVKVGDLAVPGRSLMTLVGDTALVVEAEIGDQDFAKVSVGQEVEVTCGALPDKTFSGNVIRIASDAVQKPDTILRTRILRATIAIDDTSGFLKPGMDVDVHGRGVMARDAVTVPSQALVTSGEEQSVWVLSDGRVHKRSVKVGAYTFESVQVLEGLKEGESVVVSPAETLQEGQAVAARGA
ncbi:MAG TPA: efflux RND transporter periplasmic adaptor subunit [Fimbriimonadaceae bacterium]|nr:efflux RND transporter periplasmic adaptor subunit [Fimbriimonadaceae bacterium]